MVNLDMILILGIAGFILLILGIVVAGAVVESKKVKELMVYLNRKGFKLLEGSEQEILSLYEDSPQNKTSQEENSPENPRALIKHILESSIPQQGGRVLLSDTALGEWDGKKCFFSLFSVNTGSGKNSSSTLYNGLIIPLSFPLTHKIVIRMKMPDFAENMVGSLLDQGEQPRDTVRDFSSKFVAKIVPRITPQPGSMEELGKAVLSGLTGGSSPTTTTTPPRLTDSSTEQSLLNQDFQYFLLNYHGKYPFVDEMQCQGRLVISSEGIILMGSKKVDIASVEAMMNLGVLIAQRLPIEERRRDSDGEEEVYRMGD